MFRRVLILVSIFLPLSLRAADDSLKFYVGLHVNESWSYTNDVKEVHHIEYFMMDNSPRLDNGNTMSHLNFSITAGMESTTRSLNSIRIMMGGELFFDNINKTIIQNDKPWDWDGWIRPRPMANKPIYKTNFLTGIRAKLGFTLFDVVDVYGNFGVGYWDRSIYVRISEDPYWDGLGIKGLWANFKFRPIVGLGTAIRITDSWAVNANYTYVMPSVIGGVWRDKDWNNYNYDSGGFLISIKIMTIGMLYYF
jgi:hypothetical protein